MNERIKWDHSLIKKYSSSNHLKLLSQLRSEVKKYPLDNKKTSSSNHGNDNRINQVKSISQYDSLVNSSNDNNEINNNKSTISFNNSKNFSIYTKLNNENSKEANDNNSIENKTSNEDSLSSTFKDRLNQIDMK